MRLPEVINGAVDADTLGQLEAGILVRAKPGTPYPGGANRGGWKSSVDLLSWPGVAFERLRDLIRRLLADRGYEPRSAWAVVNRNGSYHGRHRHGVPIMGILFVASGDPMVPTVFEIGAGRTEVDPIPGRIVLCGDLWHYVPTYRGQSPRIVVAFDGKAVGA